MKLARKALHGLYSAGLGALALGGVLVDDAHRDTIAAAQVAKDNLRARLEWANTRLEALPENVDHHLEVLRREVREWKSDAEMCLFQRADFEAMFDQCRSELVYLREQYPEADPNGNP